jgi:hypothetical protein
MLYLVLFSSLAIGFYAAVSTSMQVSANETKAKRAMLAAESGMAFLRHILSNLEIAHGTPVDQMWPQLVQQVKNQLDGKPVVNGQILQDVNGAVELNNCMVDNTGATFSAKLISSGDQVVVRVAGTASGLELNRTIEMAYGKAQRASTIFDYGIASRAAVTLGGNAEIRGGTDPTRGSILTTSNSAVPLSMSGFSKISGDVSWTGTGAPSFGSNIQVAGYRPSDSSFSEHIHTPADVIAPEFPVVDSSVYEKYVPGRTAPVGPQVIISSPPASRLSYTNIRIKANANPNFPNGSVLSGVIMIEKPNSINFQGVTIKGVVVEDNVPGGTLSSNSVYFGGNVTHQGVESLSDSFGDLKKLTGASLLLPSFTVTMRGNANSVGGTLVAGTFDVSGTAGANIKGSLINMSDAGSITLNGTNNIVITAAGTSDYPAGVYFGTHYVPLPDTYKEIAQ